MNHFRLAFRQLIKNPGFSTVAIVALGESVRDAAISIDPNQPVCDARPMLDRIQETSGTHRLLSFLFSIFAGLALVLATIGLYGLLSYTTLKRVREIGVRLALGARPAQIRTLILSHGLRLLLIGSIIGLVGAFAATRLLSSLLFGVSAWDPLTFSAIVILISAVAFLAAWLPARRATLVDPIQALRAE